MQRLLGQEPCESEDPAQGREPVAQKHHQPNARRSLDDMSCVGVFVDASAHRNLSVNSKRFLNL